MGERSEIFLSIPSTTLEFFLKSLGKQERIDPTPLHSTTLMMILGFESIITSLNDNPK